MEAAGIEPAQGSYPTASTQDKFGSGEETLAHTTARRAWHPEWRARSRSIAVAVSQATPITDRLDAHHHPCRCRSARLPGRDREAVQDPLGFDGADSPLREACGRLSVSRLGSSDREPNRLQVPCTRAWRHHRLQRTCEGESGLQRQWRVRQADRRASWRAGFDARRSRPHQRSSAEGALSRPRLSRAGERRMASEPPRRLLRARRQPRDVMRLTPLGRRSAREHHRPSRYPVLAAQPGGRALASAPAFRGHSRTLAQAQSTVNGECVSAAHRGVAVVEEDGVAGRIGEPGAMADTRVPHLVDLDAGRLELRLRWVRRGQSSDPPPGRDAHRLLGDFPKRQSPGYWPISQMWPPGSRKLMDS
jgi:hypothetical protein